MEAEYDDGNANVKEIRMRKAEVDELLAQLEIQTRQMSEQIGTLNKDIKVLKKQLSEVAKMLELINLIKRKILLQNDSLVN